MRIFYKIKKGRRIISSPFYCSEFDTPYFLFSFFGMKIFFLEPDEVSLIVM